MYGCVQAGLCRSGVVSGCAKEEEGEEGEEAWEGTEEVRHPTQPL